MEALSNPQFKKTFRTTVQMFREATTGTNAFGRYYFDDIRELYGKNIVGFNVDAGNLNVLYPSNLPPLDKTTFVNGQPLYVAELQLTLQYFYLNLYNDQGELILDNFPCGAATNYNNNYSIPPRYSKKNILPLDTKIDIRKSYIFGNFAAIGIDNLGISVNFYYK